MAEVCSQCGSALVEGNAFCTKCGARRNASTESAGARNFCAKCAAPLASETKFCEKCGAPADIPAGVAPVPVTPTVNAPFIPPSTAASRDADAQGVNAVPVTAPPAVPSQITASAAPAAKSSGGPKIAIIVVGIVVVCIVAGIAGVTYAVHRARQKAAQVEAQAQIEKSLVGLAAAANAAQTGNNPAAAPELTKKLAELAAAAQNANNPAAAEDLKKKLADLTAAAQDPKTQAAAQDLAKKLSDLTAAAQAGQNPNNPAAPSNDTPPIAADASGSSTSPSTLASGSTSAAGSSAAVAAASVAADAALIPPPLPEPAPIAPVAATGNQAKDWALEYERTVGGPEADLVVRTGDINNLGFGWPPGFDPFSGQSTPGHPWPDINHIPPQAPPGTDRIMLGTGVMPVHMSLQHVAGQADRIIVDSTVKSMWGDGYSGSLNDCFRIRDNATNTPNFVLAEGYVPVAAACTRARELTMPTPIVLAVGELPSKINSVVVQIFADDFQPVPTHSHFQVSLNGTRIPSFEYAINSLDQSGPIGKLLTLRLLPEYWPLLKSGEVNLLIDDPTTHAPDGYAVDFVRILVNPHNFKYQVSLTATVTDADKHTPIAGANVTAALESAATDRNGKCELKAIPAGLVVATATAPGYDENSVTVDLPAAQAGHADIQLHAHQESIAALEKSIAQTGTATIYGIHFDTGSSKLRPDSMPALEAVLGLINGRAGSNWIIAGHTDNQGSDALNIPLSKARAASVVSWLTGHGIAANRFEPQGFGATRPVADNATANGRALNRRVEVALAK